MTAAGAGRRRTVPLGDAAAAAGSVARPGGSRPVPATTFLAGVALGAGTAAGTALLLYTGQGFLATAGFLLAVSIAAAAAGIWVGGPHAGARSAPGRRWFWAVLAFAAAGAFAVLWSARPALRATGIGGALAVLLILAEPAYASGSLIGALEARDRQAHGLAPGTGGTAVAALIGAAAGILVATTVLIPNINAPGVFLAAAALLAVTAGIQATRARRATHAEDPTMNEHCVIITGVGDSGQVGFAVARRFLAAGWRAVITAPSAAVHDRAAELAASGELAAVRADLTEPADVATLIDTVRERFGRLDAVINVAGGLTVIKPLADTESDEWRREIERNAGTAYHVCRAVLPLLRERGGAIVNFAAVAGQRAAANLGAYSASKAAVIALTRSLALEERSNGVRVNAIAPAMIDTDQNRRALGDAQDTRFVTRDEIAEVAFFLATPASSGVTGATIPVVGNAIE